MNAPEHIQDLAEVASLWLTWPTIILGVAVLVHWGPHVYQQFAEKRDLDHRDWLILGITVGFLGGVIDNLWWGVAWSLDYMELPARDWWFRHGVYSNIFFRQICGAYAAYCHMVAFYRSKQRGEFHAWVTVSLIVGLLYSMLLTLIKKGS